MKSRVLMKWTVLVLTLTLLAAGTLFAAETNPEPFFKEIGFITGYGSASIREGTYETIPIILHCGTDLSRFFPGLKGHRGLVTAFIEPQVNPVIGPEDDIEAGIGIGLQYQYPVTTFFSLYVNAATGPFYVSVDTTDQADGFIFSNHVGAGAYFFLNKNTAVNAGYRFRHMSNANTHEPNGGIDSHFGVIGVSWFY
jgi:lipid A 3-O-deacylase